MNVTHAEYNQTEPSISPSSSAPSSSVLVRQERLASIHQRSLFATFLLAVAVLMAFSPPAASADTRIGEAGGFAGQLFFPDGLAVSQREGGDLYVVDPPNQRIDQFEPNGAFVRAFGWGVVPGAATGTGHLVQGSDKVETVTTTTGAFVVGQIVTGPGISPGTVITQVNASELTLSQPATGGAAAAPLTVAASPGNVPTNELQTLTLGGSPTGGAFTLAFAGPDPDPVFAETGAIPYNATAAQLESALQALASIGSGNVSVSGPAGGPWTIEFAGTRYSDTNVPRLAVNPAGLTPSGTGTVTTARQGGAALETCTTICRPGEEGSGPGQLQWSDEIAVDNDPASGSYGDLYLVDQRNYRVEKFSPQGELLLMFGGEVDKTTHANSCTAADLAGGDTCGAGIPGTSPSQFFPEWSREGDNSIAVGPNGVVYVGDYNRIQEFSDEGNYTGELKLEDAQPQLVTSLAIDSSGDVFERSARYENFGSPLSAIPGVREYGPAPTHPLLRTFATEAGAEPTHLALDPAGDLFVSDAANGEIHFRAFRPNGDLYAVVTSDQVTQSAGGYPRGIAIGGSAAKLYATALTRPQNGPQESYVAAVPLPEPGPPVIEGPRESAIQPTTATLAAVLNPQEFDTHYHFEYTTTNFAECGLPANPNCEETSSVDLGSVWQKNPVQAGLSALTPATTYHWRLVAESSYGGGTTVDGPTQTFQTLPALSVRGLATQRVSPEEVAIKAELNNNNSISASHWELCLGTACREGNLKAGASSFEPIAVEFGGLQPDTEYHYQLVAGNEYGQVEFLDQAVTTEETIAEQDGREGCSNALRREENHSLALADCRAYEQVSSPAKNGSEAFAAQLLAPSGERLKYSSFGDFAGAVLDETGIGYLAQRTESGWVTQALDGLTPAPGYQAQGINGFGPDEELSPELDRWLFAELPGLSQGASQQAANTGYYVLGNSDGSYHRPASPTISLAEGPLREPRYFMPATQASTDLSRFFIATSARDLSAANGDPRPDDNETAYPSRIYEVSGAGGGAPAIRLVAEVPLGLPSTGFQNTGPCQVKMGEGGGDRASSADGSTLFFAAPIEEAAGEHCGEGYPNPYGLFARTASDPAGPATVIQLNRESGCAAPNPCHGAAPRTPTYQGSSTDGRIAWFSTRQPLTDSDQDNGSGETANDLYFARLSESGTLEKLVQASHGEASDPTPGQGAGVQGVVRISPDGSRAAFVATGVLTTEPNASNREAVQGADNLYLFDVASGETRFITTLCSGPGLSGSVPESSCPQGLGTSQGENDARLWQGGNARLTPDGNFLLLESYGRLTPDDTDNAVDIYRYDIRTGQLLRVSIGRRGNDANGNDDSYPAQFAATGKRSGNAYELAEDGARAMSADGSTVIFTTNAPLVSHDTNHAPDVYEWEEDGHGSCEEPSGCIGLVSDGVDPHGTRDALIGSSGRDITFFTIAGLAPGDTDGVGDIYDARERGGFPYLAQKEPCGGAEGCHGEATQESVPINPVTEGNQHGPEGESELHCAKGKHKVKKHGQFRCVAKRRHHRHAHRQGQHHRRTTRTNSNRGGSK